MKRFILTLFTLTFLFYMQGFAQCTPDPAYTDPGIHPPADSISEVHRNVAYSEIITINIPGSFSGVTIDNITITDITGFPVGISYDCTPSSCVFPGGGSYCIDINGTTSDTVGTYPLEIEGEGTVVILGQPSTMSLTDLINLSQGALTMPEYKLVVVDTTGSSPQFNVSVNASDINVCSGENVSLSVEIFNGEATNYDWSPAATLDNTTSASPTATPTSTTTTYTVTVTDTSGVTATASVIINVKPQPVAAFTSVDNGNGAFDFSASTSSGSGLSYSWDFGDDSAAGSGVSTSHTYAADGEYTVELTITDECNATATASDEVNALITSIQNLADAVNFVKVYPNPSNGNFEIRISANEINSNYSIRVIDLQGKMLFNEAASNNALNFNKALDLNHLNSGVYFLHIESNGLSYVNRLVIQK